MNGIMSANLMASKFFGLRDEEPSSKGIDHILSLTASAEVPLSVFSIMEDYALEDSEEPEEPQLEVHKADASEDGNEVLSEAGEKVNLEEIAEESIKIDPSDRFSHTNYS